MPLFRFFSPRSLRLPLYSRSLSHQNPNPNPTPSLSSAGPLSCRLTTRAVIRFRGPDTVKFLQGLLTNDVRPLAHPLKTSTGDYASYLPTPNAPFRAPPPIYAAMLTPQGRFLYDFFLYRKPSREVMLDNTGSGPGSEEEPFTVMADVDASVLNEVLACFKKYRLRAKVEIDNVADEFFCWQRFGGNLSKTEPTNVEPEADAVGWGTSVDRAGESAAHGNSQGWQWFTDPRLNCLGFRGIFPSSIIPPLVESDKEADEQHYLLWRVERGVAEGSTEIPKGEAIPLEYNLVGLNAISFDKGCYVGQELVARTHHRGVIRKRLLPVRFTDEKGEDVEQEVSPGSEVVDSISNKKVGTVTTALGNCGMGVLKLDEAFKQPANLPIEGKGDMKVKAIRFLLDEALKQSANLTIKGKSDVKVKAIRPDWWPEEWTRSLEQQTATA